MKFKRLPLHQQRQVRTTEKEVPLSVSFTDDECLQMKEVAQRYLKCSLAQAYRLANAGLIPALRVRGMVRVPRARLMVWIAQNTSGGSGEMQ
jgi:excisionase family DNA binding protein